MKAILIARVSTEEQKEAGNSLPAQIVRLEQYCLNRGFQILRTCSFDESAYSSNRTEFDAIIDYALNQKEKVAICCDKVDRLSRNTFDKRISILYEKALSDQVELHFVSDGQIINSKISAVEKFQFGISLGLAKYYSDAISDNVKRAIEQKLRKGEWPAKAPYGYKNISLGGDKTGIIVDEFASEVVRKAFEFYATGAFSFNTLRKKIKDDYGVDWAHGNVDKILNYTFYHGIMTINGKTYPHQYPTIITQALYQEVQDVRKKHSKHTQHFKAKLDILYRGLIRCGDCGLAITHERQKGHVYYHCTQAKGKHGATWFREEKITAEIGKIFASFQMPKNVLEDTIEVLNEVHMNKIEFHKQEQAKLLKEQSTISSMIDNLYMDKLKGSITDAQYDKFFTTLKDRATDVAIRLEQLQETESNYYITAELLLKLADRAYDIFMSSEVEQKRLLIQTVLSNLKISGGNVDCELRTPFCLIAKSGDCLEWRPQGDLNPCFRRERAASWTGLDDGDVNNFII